PVPPPAPRGRIGIVHGEREAFGPGRRAAPGERGRHVLARAAEAVEDVVHADGGAVLQGGGGEGELGLGVGGEGGRGGAESERGKRSNGSHRSRPRCGLVLKSAG